MYKSEKHNYEKGSLRYAEECLKEFNDNEPAISWCVIEDWVNPGRFYVSMLSVCQKFWPDAIVRIR